GSHSSLPNLRCDSLRSKALTPRTAPGRCGVSLPARLRRGSGEHCCEVIFPTAAKSLLILWTANSPSYPGAVHRKRGKRHERWCRGLDSSCRVFELSDQKSRTRRCSRFAPLRKMPYTAALGGQRVGLGLR